MNMAKSVFSLRSALGSLGFLLLVVIIWNATADYEPPILLSGAVGDVLEAEEDVERAAPSIDRFTSIVERPLFVPSRRPGLTVTRNGVSADQDRQAEVNPSGAAALDRLTLRGILISEGKRQAVVDFGSGEEAQIVEVGFLHSGWRLMVIEEEAIVFSNGATEHRLPLWEGDAAPQQ